MTSRPQSKQTKTKAKANGKTEFVVGPPPNAAVASDGLPPPVNEIEAYFAAKIQEILDYSFSPLKGQTCLLPSDVDHHEIIRLFKYRYDDFPEARTIIEVYEEIYANPKLGPGRCPPLDLDDLANRAHIAPNRLVGLMWDNIALFNKAKCEAVKVAIMPELVKRSLTKALGDDAEAQKERLAWLQSDGRIIAPKSSAIVSITNVNDNRSQVARIEDRAIDVKGLPAWDDEVKMLEAIDIEVSEPEEDDEDDKLVDDVEFEKVEEQNVNP